MKLAQSHKKIILLKITGELISRSANTFNIKNVISITKQIKALTSQYLFGIVIGGGNIFRGIEIPNKATLKITENMGHNIGMVATLINGLIIQDAFNNFDIDCVLLSAIDCPQIALSMSAQNIFQAKKQNKCLIFCGGTGNPYFTTDTSAVIRALQIDSTELWKGTKVNGVYTKDPKLFSDAILLKKLSYKYVLDNQLNIMDTKAIDLAQKHKLPIRIFNIFEENALLNLVQNKEYGSMIE